MNCTNSNLYDFLLLCDSCMYKRQEGTNVKLRNEFGNDPRKCVPNTK